MKAAVFLMAAALIGNLVAASATSSTLLIHDTLSKPFSLVNEVAPFQTILTRFDTSVKTLADSKVEAADLEQADFILLAGISGFPKLKPEALRSLQNLSKPVMAIGAASPFASRKSSSKASTPFDQAKLAYRGQEWTIRLDPFYVESDSDIQVLAKVSSPKGAYPLAWRMDNRFGFASLPSEAPLSMVFSDVLLDFYGASVQASPALVFVVKDFNPSCNPSTLRRLADYFDHLKIPFVVTTQMREVPPGVEIIPRGDFLDALRYAQTHGARVFLEGGDGPERSEVFLKEGIRILGSTDAASDTTGMVIGDVLLQRTPGEPLVPYSTAVPLRRAAGGWLIPANVHSGMDGSANDETLRSIREITSFRGGLAVLVVPAWMRFQDMLAAVETGRSTNLPAIDPSTRFSVQKEPTP
ncbi:MAG: hypothetical protein WCG66_09905 [bacterium]